MAKQEIAFGLKIDGIEQSIKSVKDLKGAISAMQTEAENADIGSDQYKNAIENIEKLNDKLKEVTQTEKQAAKATEDLAKAEQEAAKETGDLRKQFEVLEDELFMLAGQGKQNTKEFRDLANEAAGLNKRIELVNQSLEGGAATKSAEGFQMLSGSLTNIKDGLLELDFGKVKDGLMQAKAGFMMFGQGAKTALQGVKGALLATGIGALVVALGVIVAYWDEIKGAVSGVSAEQKKLNEDSAANLQTQQDKLTAISAQENILKLQGKSEKEILQIKLKQTDEAIMASDIAIQQAENTKIAQVEASKRNRDILQGIIKFVTAPITILLQGIDSIGSALGQNFNLLEKFSGGLANLVFDPEQVASEGDKAIIEARAVNDKLKNDRAGLQLSVNKIDSDAAKAASEKAKEARDKAEEERKKEDAILLAESDAFWNAELALQASYERDAYMAKKAIEDKEKADADLLLAESDAFFAEQLADQEANRVLTYQAKKKAADDELAAYAELEKEKFNLAQQGLDGIQALSDMYFLFKSQKAQKGSKEEEELAKKAFNVNKALQLATATVNGIQSVQGAFTTATASPITTLLPAYPFIQAGLAGVFAAANIAKIAASKFTGGGGGSVAPSGGAPSTPSIPPPPTIATPENNTNKTTSFDETGKNLNFQGTPTPTINVKASVGVDEITSKSNRVEVLENQSTF